MFNNLVAEQQIYDSNLNQFGLTLDHQAIYPNPHFYGHLNYSNYPYSPTTPHMPSSPPSTAISSDGEDSSAVDVDWAPFHADIHRTPTASKGKKTQEREEEDDNDDDQQSMTSSTGKVPSKRRIAHNLVEKRYRNTINSEMERLRRMIPQIVTIDAQTPDGRAKASKATVLSSAVRYIQDLERDRHRLAMENEELRMSLATFNAYRR